MIIAVDGRERGIYCVRVGRKYPLFHFDKSGIGGVSVSKIADKVTLLVEPLLVDMGFELVDVSLDKEGGKIYLRVYIDKEGGVTIDDCSDVSREIDKVLDDNDVVSHDFLEVSSPGIERVLKKDKDFEKHKGQDVVVKFFTNKYGKKKIEGKLVGKEGSVITIEGEDGLVSFSQVDVALIKTIFKF